MNTSQSSPTSAPSPLALLLARWPSVVGLGALIASSAGGVDAHITAMIIMIAALCYLTAAAVGQRIAAWIAIPVLTAVVVIGRITALDAVMLLLVLAAAVTVWGLIRRSRSAWPELWIQVAGFVVFAGLGLVAMLLDPILAAHLAGLLAIGHGVWDVIHHRRDRVVSRSFAEFCAVLDLGLGGVTLIITWIGLAV